MSVCPQFLCIRPCKDNPQAPSFSPPHMTSFGFTEFISNIPEEIKVQSLYCHEFRDKDIKKCGTSGFISENSKNICEKVISNFHLCIKNSKGLIYIYFQKRGKLCEINAEEVLKELFTIHKYNCNVIGEYNDIFLVILVCCQPSHSTSNIAIENQRVKELEKLSEEKIKKCIKIELISTATRLTFSSNNVYPFGINIVGG